MEKETPYADRLVASKERWDELVLSMPATVTLQNNVIAPREIISDWFATVIDAVKHVESDTPDLGMMAIHWPGVTNNIAPLEAHVNAAVSNGAAWAAQTAQTPMSHLWAIRSSLAWLLPASLTNVETQYPTVGEILASATRVSDAASEAARKGSEMTQNLKAAEDLNKQITALVEKVNGYERAASNAQTASAASATIAETERQRVDQYVAELTGAVTKQQTLFEEFEGYRGVVEGTIQGASKVALAKSFQTRREALSNTQKIWAFVFGGGITVLFLSGGLIGWELLSHSPPGTAASEALHAASAASAASVASAASSITATSLKLDLSNFLGTILRFLILSPLIWLTWFAARQYGHCQRLAEDYAFKEAAAHAFVGYRSEMGDDPEMIKLLREYAIKNFGANPTRVLEKNDPVTPLNDIFERALDKVSPDKLMDLLKEAIASAKK